MSIQDTIRRIKQSEEEVRRRYLTRYTCVICGVGDINYETVLQLAMFIPNHKGCYVDTGLAKTMVVCSEPCRKQYIAQGMVPYEYLMEGVGVPKRFWEKKSDWVNGSKKSTTIENWLNHNGKSLYICGDTGTGKTTLALNLAYEMRKHEYRVKFYRSSELVIRANNIRFDDALDNLMEELNAYDIIIIDDITKHNLTTSGKECIFNIYNDFYENERQVVFTSNYRIGDVSRNIDERLGSRILEMCDEVVVAGKDKRLKVDGENKNPGKQ